MQGRRRFPYVRWSEYGAVYTERQKTREALYDWVRPGDVAIGVVISILLMTIAGWFALRLPPTYEIPLFVVFGWLATSTVCLSYLSSVALPSRATAEEPSLRERLTPDFSTLFSEGTLRGRYGDPPYSGYPFGYYWGYDTSPIWIVIYILLLVGLESLPHLVNVGGWAYVVGFFALLLLSGLLLPILIGWFSWYAYAILVAPFRALQVAHLESRFHRLEEEVKREFNDLQRMVAEEISRRNGNHSELFRPMTFADHWVNAEYGLALARLQMVWLLRLPEGDDLSRWVDSLELAAGIKPDSPDGWVRQVVDLDGRIATAGTSDPGTLAKQTAIRTLLRPLVLMKLRYLGRASFSAKSLQTLLKFLHDSPREMLVQPAFLRELRELGKRLNAIEPVARLTDHALRGMTEQEIIARYHAIRDHAERSHLAESLASLHQYLAGNLSSVTLPTPEEARSQILAWAEIGPPNLRLPSRILTQENFAVTDNVMRGFLQQPLPSVPLFWRMLAGWLSGAPIQVAFMDFFLWALAFLEIARDFGADREVGSAIWVLLRDTLMAESAHTLSHRIAEERAALQSLLKPQMRIPWSALPEDLVETRSPA